jgi:ComF family protein
VLLDPLLSILWPSRCAGCGVFVPEARAFCPECEWTLVPLGPCCPGCAMPFDGPVCGGCRTRPFPFSQAKAALAYGGALSQAILRFKHGGQRHLAAPLARYLAPILSSMLEPGEIVCPVPLHHQRLRRRGFNQALEILRAANRALPKNRRGRVVPDALSRKVDTLALGRGSPVARARAVAGAFAVARPVAVASKRVLVVDDVMTSGATLAECARTLLAAGAAQVSVAVLARAI